ncbi:MAG: hypothetical protein H6558_20745 [Lewinellaceae bacterium]|nr:hypothetical protein [Lewinellaceae bacterium]MCB9288762.1 hypothetical protein [Lewinellaceae bacterium]
MLLTILAILIALLILLLTWVLFAPLSIRADTYEDKYYLQWGGIGKAELIPAPEDILIRLRVAFWKKDFYPLHFSARKSEKKEEPAPAEKKKRKRHFPFRRLIRVLKSFNIKDFRLEIDTDDFVWNAYLWPVVHNIAPLRRHITVNFQGRNECRILIQNRIWRMAWAWLRGKP